MNIHGSPTKGPAYVLHRKVTEPDVIPLTVKAHGLNSSGYEEIHVLVVPYTRAPTA